MNRRLQWKCSFFHFLISLLAVTVCDSKKILLEKVGNNERKSHKVKETLSSLQEAGNVMVLNEEQYFCVYPRDPPQTGSNQNPDDFENRPKVTEGDKQPHFPHHILPKLHTKIARFSPVNEDSVEALTSKQMYRNNQGACSFKSALSWSFRAETSCPHRTAGPSPGPLR